MSGGNLRLRAESAEDLEVMSGVLQDALLPVSDMAFLKDSDQFALVANRFCWEGEAQSGDGNQAESGQDRPHQRINCGVLFSKVIGVKTRGFDQNEGANILSLLTMQTERGVDGAEITLICAGDASIQLKVAGIDCRLDDIGEPWPTVWRPSHGDAEAD